MSTNLPENLRRLRKARGISGAELARRMGVTRQAVSRWELGANEPLVAQLVALAGILAVSLDDLVTTAPDQQTTAPG